VKTLYIDINNTLVNFTAKLEGIASDVLKEFHGREDEIPGVFALMPPMPGAVAAFKELARLFGTYILSTAPWLNPSAWQHKLEWVHLHLGRHKGTVAYKRLILTHHKGVNRGDFLVDDRPHKIGPEAFEGEVIGCGSNEFPDWPTVTAYLRERA